MFLCHVALYYATTDVDVDYCGHSYNAGKDVDMAKNVDISKKTWAMRP